MSQSRYRLLIAFVLGVIGAAALYGLSGTSQGSSQLNLCNSSDRKSGVTMRVEGGSTQLRTEPNESSPALVNQRATEALKQLQHAVIDRSTVVVEECTRAGWSRVRVTEPAWLSKTHIGWVPSSSLRPMSISGDGFRTFDEGDFIWDEKTIPHKPVIIAGVNQLHREDSLCQKAIHPSSAYISAKESKPDVPVFFVTCGNGAESQNIHFTQDHR